MAPVLASRTKPLDDELLAFPNEQAPDSFNPPPPVSQPLLLPRMLHPPFLHTRPSS